MGTVHYFPQDRSRRVNGNGGGDGISYRLRALEEDVRGIKQDLKAVDDRLHTVEGDLKVIKERLSHTATKAWVLGGVLSGMVAAGAIGVGLARLLSSGG